MKYNDFRTLTQRSSIPRHGSAAHPQKYPTAPVSAHPTPNDTSKRLRSLLFLIPSLNPVTNGTSAFAFQNPVMCIYAPTVAATFVNASTCEILGRKKSVTELIRERHIYSRLESSSIVLVIECVKALCLYDVTNTER